MSSPERELAPFHRSLSSSSIRCRGAACCACSHLIVIASAFCHCERSEAISIRISRARREGAEGERGRSGSFSKLFRRLFVDGATRTDGNDPDGPMSSIDAVDDAEPPNPVLPVTLQFLLQWFAAGWIVTKGANSLPDAAFQIRMEMTDDFGHPWRDSRPEQGHYRLRFLTG